MKNIIQELLGKIKLSRENLIEIDETIFRNLCNDFLRTGILPNPKCVDSIGTIIQFYEVVICSQQNKYLENVINIFEYAAKKSAKNDFGVKKYYYSYSYSY